MPVKLCARCHVAERKYPTNPYCMKCNARRARESVKANRHKPCSACGINDRVPSSTQCRECRADYDRTWRIERRAVPAPKPKRRPVVTFPKIKVVIRPDIHARFLKVLARS